MSDPIKKATDILPWWRVLLKNRYLSLLIETALISKWAAFAFRQHSTDEVVACILVVMICSIVWQEVLDHLIPAAGEWFSRYRKERFGSATAPERPVLPLIKIAGWSVAIALALFLIGELYAIVFLISATVFSFSSLNWAFVGALHAGIFVGSIGVAFLLLATMIVVAAVILSLVSFSDLAIRIVQKTYLLILIMPPLFGGSGQSTTDSISQQTASYSRTI